MTPTAINRCRVHRHAPVLALLALLANTTAGAASLTVNTTSDPGSDDEQCSLREAVAAANANTNTGGCIADGAFGDDSIVFAPALAGETIDLNAGELVVTELLTIDGSAAETEADADPVVIDANGPADTPSGNTSRLFNLSADTTLRALLLNGGRAVNADGGSILIASGAALEAIDVGIFDSRATGAAAGRGGAIYIAADGALTLRDSSIGGGTAERGGGAIYDDSGTPGAVSLTASTITDNRAGVFAEGDAGLTPSPGAAPADGGGLFLPSGGDIQGADDGSNSILENNTATGSGGGLWTGGDTTIRNAVLLNNTALGNGEGSDAATGGGGIYSEGAALAIALSRLDSNTAAGAAGAGGGLLMIGGSVTVDANVINGNYASTAGAGVALRDGATGELNRSLFQDNGAANNSAAADTATARGGALHADGAGPVNLRNGSLVANTAAISGGGLWSSGSEVTVTGIDIRNNTARGNDADEGGAGIYQSDTAALTVADSRLLGNAATGESGAGGAIFNAGGNLTLRDAELTRNSAESAGGGIATTGGTVSLTRATLGGDDSADGNLAGTNPGYGGALHAAGGSVIIADSSIAHNTAVQGGGLWHGAAGALSVRNSTISSNQANNSGDTAGEGGGLYQVAGGSSELRFATVARNTADSAGGGVAVGAQASADVSAFASIISENRAPDGANFVSGSLAFDEAENIVGAGAALESLALFGGSTRNHAPADESLALDLLAAGNCAAEPEDRDQRGAERPAARNDGDTANCDAGSVEITAAPVLAVATNGADRVGAEIGEDLPVLAFGLTNNGEDTVVLAGFNAESLYNGGFGALLALLPEGFDPDDSLQYEVVVDADGDGRLDTADNEVIGAAETGLGRRYDFSGGRAIAPGERQNLLVVLRAPAGAENADTAAFNTVMPVDDHFAPPLAAGGFLLALGGIAGLLSGRRRHGSHWLLLALALTAAALAACSEADQVPPPDPTFFGDPALQADIRFRLIQLRGGAETQNEIVIGAGLPVFGPGITAP